MPSKMVVDRQKRSLLIIAAGHEHDEAIAQAIAREFGPYLQHGEKLPDLKLLVQLATRRLEQGVTVMTNADELHILELGDDDEPRQRRDAAAATLTQTISDLREIATGMFKSDVLKTLGLESAPKADPAMLPSYVNIVTTNLKTRSLPPSRIPDAKFNAAGWVKKLDAERETLDKALKDVARETREAETTLTQKNAAMSAHDASQSVVAGFMASLLELAGQPELAGRVQPVRRAGRAAAPEDNGGGEGGGGAGGGGGGA